MACINTVDRHRQAHLRHQVHGGDLPLLQIARNWKQSYVEVFFQDYDPDQLSLAEVVAAANDDQFFHAMYSDKHCAC